MKPHLLNFFVLILILFFSLHSFAQNGRLKGKIYDHSFQKISGAVIQIKELSRTTLSDSSGDFIFFNLPDGEYTVTTNLLGYQAQWRTVDINNGGSVGISFILKENNLDIKEIIIEANATEKDNVISKIDMQLRPVSSSQDLLRLVPGLFIAQHAGGGKAEQIFLRGFDVDHGTDFAIYADGMPVNMPSHAHGQGYADLHFLIPETVSELEVNKGPYATKYGDLATAGSGEFNTLNSIEKNQVKIEHGMFNTQRALAMVNLLDNKHLLSDQKENLYFAGEYKFTDSYFKSKQDFTRINLFSKYTSILNNGNSVSLSLSTFQSNWDASGQIPERKVADGTITRYGSIDPTEGGETGRSNINLIYTQPFSNSVLKNQFYYSRYDFNLYSNFTFYLNDSVNGDQIRQEDHRNIFGYVSTYQIDHRIGDKKLLSEFGGGVRYDNSDIKLLHTVQRVFLNDIVNGRLNQINAWLYADENLDLTSKWRINLGTRIDVYNFDFKDHQYDTASGNVTKALVNPKLNLFYTINNSVQLFAKSGFGFHSNDARAVVIGKLENTLPRAFGYEAGSTFKLGERILINTALWGLDLESELVYVGDEGVVEASGRTRRLGIDLGVRYQLSEFLFADADINYNKGFLRDEPADANRIPLAPTLTSIGGISYKRSSGFNASLRYRYMDNRAAIEDNSIIAKGYFLTDLVMNYSVKKYLFGIAIENLLNVKWNEAQFATESRLQNETASVNELHYTPGTPFFLKASVTYSF
jgi:outer membrane receptor protein involved in Fe transport